MPSLLALRAVQLGAQDVEAPGRREARLAVEAPGRALLSRPEEPGRMRAERLHARQRQVQQNLAQAEAALIASDPERPEALQAKLVRGEHRPADELPVGSTRDHDPFQRETAAHGVPDRSGPVGAEV